MCGFKYRRQAHGQRAPERRGLHLQQRHRQDSLLSLWYGIVSAVWRTKLTNLGLAKPVRAVAFSPGNSRLAAAGDAGIIALYDMKHGEHVGNLTGHVSWITTLDWSSTGEFLLSGSMDGKVKVWSVERNACVATHSETDKTLWAARWLPKTGRSEMFCTAGANRSISFYREATGG